MRENLAKPDLGWCQESYKFEIYEDKREHTSSIKCLSQPPSFSMPLKLFLKVCLIIFGQVLH